MKFNKQLSNVSIKVSAYALGLVAIVLLGTAVAATITSYKVIYHQTLVESKAAVRFASHSLDMRMERLANATHFLSERSQLITDDPNSTYKPLEDLLLANPSVSAAGLMFIENYYPQEGREFAPMVERNSESDGFLHLNAVSLGFSYLGPEGDENWKASTQGHTIWSEPYYSSLGHEMRIAYSVPLYHDNEQLFAVLYLTMDLDWLKDLLDECNPHGRECSISAVSKQGLYISCPDSSKVMKTSIQDEAAAIGTETFREFAEKVCRKDSGSMYIDTPKREFVYFYPLPSTDWTIIYRYDVAITHQPVMRFVSSMIIIFLSAMVILFLLLALGIFRIIKPFSNNLRNISESKARIERDLLIAYTLQQRLLPETDANRCQDMPDIYGQLIPARMVGGDLFDFFVREGKLIFCIGDVSGKGVPAALFMAVVRTLLHEITRHTLSPAKIMTQLNGGLIESNNDNMFCTMFLGVIDLHTGELRYCNAGHNPPILCQRKDHNMMASFMEPEIHAAIGLFEDEAYTSESLMLHQDDTLFLYTDGVTEACDNADNLFGEQPLLDVLISPYTSAKDTIEAVRNAVQAFVNGAEQSDDITMLCINYPHASDKLLTLSNDISQIPALTAWFKQMCEQLNIPEEARFNARLALEEVVVNVMEYAYGEEKNRPVYITAESYNDEIRFIIEDEGNPYNPLEDIRKPDENSPLEDCSIGGLGIFLYKELMKNVEYRYENKRNKLILTL